MGGTRGGVGVSGKIEALLLPASDLPARSWELANSSCSPMGSAGRLLQGFYRAQDLGTIAMEL